MFKRRASSSDLASAFAAQDATQPPHFPRKRARLMAPPPENGQQQHGATHSHESDDGEEDDLDPNRAASQVPQNTEYQATNTTLYELHALHRHRLLFAPDKHILHDPNKHFEAGREGYEVQERYGQSNKLLGNLFLNRRRELEHP
uniref:Uncharacterized protein n=1 Tax=Mycena chlorophos TaxID=658473 RepID=A0ABQ0L9T6_MYCCL|nr:predicted protein [Mycena chlorophos]